MSDKDKNHLLNILDCIARIQRYTSDISDADSFFQDEKSFDAVLMNFVTIGETISKITDEMKESHAFIPRQKIKAFRNLIAHNYFGVDAEEVWQIIHNNLPRLKKDIEKALF